MIMKIIKYVFGGFFLLVVLAAVFGSGGGGNSERSSSTSVKQEQPSQQIEYTPVDVNTMVADLENNAAAAQKRYKGKYLKVSGQLGNIDSDMSYITIKSSETYSFINVQCFLRDGNQAQEDYVMNLSKGQWVTAYGQITDVGEILGYHMKVDKFE